VPCAEQVRFTSTGSGGHLLLALRVARAARGATKILKFEGGYHGANDYAMIAWRSPVSGAGADSSGIPRHRGRRADRPYSDLATVEGIVDTRRRAGRGSSSPSSG
jgi:glutamate-1-semialdehyde 2,1-aminomutase